MSSTSQEPPTSAEESNLPAPREAARVLVVDDDRMVRDGLRDILGRAGYTVETAKDGKTALDKIADHPPDLLFLDLKLPRAGGLEILNETQDSYPEIPVVIISGKGSVSDVVEAVKGGAHDFLEKPIDAQHTLVTAANAMEAARLRRQRDRLLKEVRDRYKMIGSSESMQQVYDQIDKAARATSTVLITGESGTGKEMVARAIHLNSSEAGGPLVTVNCAAIPPDLIESELFGHKEGAFTGAKADREGKFQQADGGTLLLDEVADMSLKAQSKTLRALDQKKVQPVGSSKPVDVDVRLIAATNRDLETAIDEGTFREDLYFRLDVIRIEMPPLRARRDDIPDLAEHFVKTISAENDLERRRLSSGAMQELMGYDWPGNVRELRNVIEQLVVLSEGPEIGAGAVQDALGGQADAPTEVGSGLDEARKQFERVYIQQALREHEGQIQKAADALEIDRSTLWRKINEHDLEAD
jgi:two-component system nitrogen regulation response regulator NtrX